MRLSSFHWLSGSHLDLSITFHAFHAIQFMVLFVQSGQSILIGCPNSRYGLLLHIRTLAFDSCHACVLIAVCLSRSSVEQTPVTNRTAVRLRDNTNYNTIPSHMVCCVTDQSLGMRLRKSTLCLLGFWQKGGTRHAEKPEDQPT